MRGLTTFALLTLTTFALGVAGCSSSSVTGANSENPGADASTDASTPPTTVSDAGWAEDAASPELTDSSKEDGSDPEDHGFGAPCDSGDDCFSGLCTEHMGDQVCTKTCEDECPSGWSCESVTISGGDAIYLCVSSFEHLCRPCMSGDDCVSETSEAACIDYDGQGGFCGAGCEGDSDCPEGFACQESISTRGGSSKQCVDVDGVCECSDIATELGLATKCALTNDFGTCEGLRTCGPEGLSECDAPTPAEEVCNGVDDDCDGTTDGMDCDDENPCTEDVCQGEAGCSNTITTGAPCDDSDPTTSGDTCTAEGACTGEPIVCPSHQCILEASPNGSDCDVTYKPQGAYCDDEDATTKDDLCDGADGCKGTHYSCEPTQCEASSTPNGVGCDVEYWAAETPCDDEDVNTKDDQCDGQGGCAGTPYTCEPTQCEAESVADGAGCVPSPKAQGIACDDEDPGTKADACDGQGGCVGEPYACEPTQCEVTSTPNGTGCDPEYAASDQPCDDSDPNTSGDTCDGQGGCQGTPYTCAPGLCELASTPNGEGCDVTYATEGAACDDQDPTTLGDQCDDAGGCEGTPYACIPDDCELTSTANGVDCDVEHKAQGTPCDDGDENTKGDACDGGGGCVGEPYGCVPSQCEASSVPDGESCQVSFVAQGVTCDDGDENTKGDECDGSGGCQGTPYVCEPTQCELQSVPDGEGCAVQYAPAAVACDDGDPATKIDVCDGFGGCAGQPYTCEPTQCDADAIPNGTDCDIFPKAQGIACDDQDLATKDDQCDGESGCQGTPYTCDKGTCELSSTPNGTGCEVVYAQADTPCDDLEPGTKTDVCDGSGGCAGQPYTCETGICETASVPDGVGCAITYADASTPCDDDDMGTKGDQCDGAGGCAGSAYACWPGQCQLSASPDGVGCAVVYAPEGAGCDDDDFTTIDDHCDGFGGCAGELSCLLDESCPCGELFSGHLAFGAIAQDGSVSTWGGPGGDSSGVAAILAGGSIQHVATSQRAFAALMEDGSVITWGDASYGGTMALTDANALPVYVFAELSAGVTQVVGIERAFAALKEDGSVVTWGDASHGGDSSEVAEALQSEVVALYGTGTPYGYGEAFAALKEDGSVVTWGNAGADISGVSDDLSSGVVTLVSARDAFAALKSDGSVISWGASTSNKSLVAAQLAFGVQGIVATNQAFAALKGDGSVVTWGSASCGGDSATVQLKLLGGVTRITASACAFSALKEDGSVVTWGGEEYGGLSVGVAEALSGDVVKVFSNAWAFAALKGDGSVITWGHEGYGGDSAEVAGALSGGVLTLFSTDRAFSALKTDGSVITWGHDSWGGNSDAVAEALMGGIKTIASTEQAFAALADSGEVIVWGMKSAGGDPEDVEALNLCDSECGDEIVEGAEGCDDGNTAIETCAYGQESCEVCGPDCAYVPGIVSGYCGDEVIQGSEGEACDDGNTTDGDGCSSDCTMYCQSIDLDGIDDQVDMHVMAPWQDFTAEVWVKPHPSSASGYARLVDSDSGADYFLLHLNNGVPAVDLRDSSAASLHIEASDGVSIIDGSWHHLAVVREGVIVTLFVDGALAATGTTPYFEFIHGVALSAGFTKYPASADQRYAGLLTEVRISDGARYTETFTPETTLGSDASTLGYWALNGELTGEGSDSSTATLVGGPEWVADGPECGEGAQCGDDVKAAWEQCDDGNTADGDGCTATCLLDVDDDGVTADSDCDDENPDAYPGAPETIDSGVDTNCDGCREVSGPGSIYTFCDAEPYLSWTASEVDCEARGGHLLVIDDAEEYALIQALGKSLEVPIAHLSLGLSDQGSEGNWQWATGVSGYFVWAPGEPSGGVSENCVTFDFLDDLYPGDAAGYRDYPCSGPGPYVCEVSIPLCGDGVTEGDEACDDGNTLNGDTCSATCDAVTVPTIMTWTDTITGSCQGTIYQSFGAIAAEMPTGPLTVTIEANQVAPLANYGSWSATFPEQTCVKTWLEAIGNQDVSTYNNWNPGVCEAVDSAGVTYRFICKNDGAGAPQIAIQAAGAEPADEMKLYMLDRTGPWCDLAGVNNRPGFDIQVTNSNDSGVSGDSVSFTW